LGNGDREGGGKGKGAWRYRAFLRGGWREGERWWEEALGGSLEEQRRANLGVLEGIRRGMEVVRSL
jgi:hypothetical protein